MDSMVSRQRVNSPGHVDCLHSNSSAGQLHTVMATNRGGRPAVRLFGTALPDHHRVLQQGSSSTRSIVARQAWDVLRRGRAVRGGGSMTAQRGMDVPATGSVPASKDGFSRTGDPLFTAADVARVMYLTYESGRERLRVIAPVSQIHSKSQFLPEPHPAVLPATMGASLTDSFTSKRTDGDASTA